MSQCFTELPRFHEIIRGDMAWHDPRQIEEWLDEIVAHMSMVLQKYLRNEYADLDAYNAAAGEVAEAYRLVAIAGFPAGFTRKTPDQLLTIAKSGLRVGGYVVATADEAAPVPHGCNATELARVCTVLKGRATAASCCRPTGWRSPTCPEPSRSAWSTRPTPRPRSRTKLRSASPSSRPHASGRPPASMALPYPSAASARATSRSSNSGKVAVPPTTR